MSSELGTNFIEVHFTVILVRLPSFTIKHENKYGGIAHINRKTIIQVLVSHHLRILAHH